MTVIQNALYEEWDVSGPPSGHIWQIHVKLMSQSSMQMVQLVNTSHT